MGMKRRERNNRPSRFLALIGPGLLVAATGVGAGDLATSGFAGSKLGTAILWAVALGAILKCALNEGLARWQLVTGETLLEGALGRLGRPAGAVFLLYLLPWSFCVGAALISACGVTFQAMAPLGGDPVRGKLVYGAVHSLAGVVLAWQGGYRLFEKVMAGCIAVMFAAVIVTAVLLRPDPAEIALGLVAPRIPQFHGGGLTWTIALMGGVGGTVTILGYGYWIRERGRLGSEDLRTCRIDLAVGYAMTAAFGMAMIVIARGMELDGQGVTLMLGLAQQLQEQIGPAGRWIFLVGAWAAVFSSLLGVWQVVPTIFADAWSLLRQPQRLRRDGRPASSATTSRAYRLFLITLAVVPLVQVSHSFREVQKSYALLGAAFIPLLALVLLVLNGRTAWIGARHRNGPLAIALLSSALALALLAGYVQIKSLAQ
jgi:Mn2+/Fe2+ NRAMP family transporter